MSCWGCCGPCLPEPKPWLAGGKYVPRWPAAAEGERVEHRPACRTDTDRSSAAETTRAGTPPPRLAVVRGSGKGPGHRARAGGRGGMVIGAIDETGQEKAGEATAGVKRQYLGCAGKVANGISTVHLAYVREKGRARADRRPPAGPQRAHRGPGEVPAHGAAAGPGLPDQGQLAIDVCAGAYATASVSTSPAATRSTATARSCASSSRPKARRTCCGFRRTSPSPWRRGRR